MATKKTNSTKEVLKEKAEKNEKIRLRDRVTVKITKATQHFAKDYEFKAHPSMADVHVKNGYAKIVK